MRRTKSSAAKPKVRPKKVASKKKTEVKKPSSKNIDIRNFRIYIVTLQCFAGDYYNESKIILFGKDEEIPIPRNLYYEPEKYHRKIKGFIAVPKGKHMSKQFKNIKEYNRAVKEAGAIRLS